MKYLALSGLGLILILFLFLLSKAFKEEGRTLKCGIECIPHNGKMIDEECFCKTLSGWTKPGMVER